MRTVGATAVRRVVELGRSGRALEWWRRCITQWMSEGRADEGWGGDRARVAAWEATELW
jgi:hypothetical protein